MICSKCQAELREGSNYCHLCGAAVKAVSPATSETKIDLDVGSVANGGVVLPKLEVPPGGSVQIGGKERHGDTVQGPKIVGDLKARRDIILGNQYNLADLSQVEALLAQILERLRDPQVTLQIIERRRQLAAIHMVGADGSILEIPPEYTGHLGLLQRGAEPQRREEIYLVRFTLDRLYARWERMYLPLSGRLLLEPTLRMTDAADQGISPAGLPLSDLREAITVHNKTRLVILGEPGAGKTTTLERLALDLARERLRDPVGAKIPLRVDLFKFTGQRNPSEFLSVEWQNGGLAETYGEAIQQGKVCFLLDGLNQMPKADRAQRIELWSHWANRDLPEPNWAVFTCRTADYVSSLRLPEVHVQTLDRDQMRRYFEQRFGPEQSGRYWGDFERRLRSGDQRFERLARNPFMLSLLADNCAEGQGLNENRAQLMGGLARRLLDWELSEGRQPSHLTADPFGTFSAAMDALSLLGFVMQQRGEGTGLSQAAARRLNPGRLPGMPLSMEDILKLALDAHILENTTLQGRKGDQPGYAFYHHLLQEYFAARRLKDLFRSWRWFLLRLGVRWRKWQFWPQRLHFGRAIPPPPVTGWEETVIMAASLAGKDALAFIAAVRRRNLPLAGRCLAEIGQQREDLAQLAQETRARLLARQHSPAAHLRSRIAAGLALGELGHPDFEVRTFEFEGRAVQAILPPLQPVPAGVFLLGSEPDDPQAFANEKTAKRRVGLPDYRIGRYPLTNAEYRYFIMDGGYQQDRWWSPQGREWKQGGPHAHDSAIQDWLKFREQIRGQGLLAIAARYGWHPAVLRFWQEVISLSDEDARQRAVQIFERPFDRPAFWDDPELSSPGRPLVGVNWYEAEAYCAWLSAVSGKTFRLPGEMEWEKAARGVDGRNYPWGNAFQPQWCNTLEGHVMTTTPVGLYPQGVSPYGLFDASGNVWEWTADWYQAYPGGDPGASDDFGQKFRVVRGGSWSLNRRLARCAYRDWNTPDNFLGNVGFRVVSPG
jgi:formylglycine-generating enzyme required for sulfatase activity